MHIHSESVPNYRKCGLAGTFHFICGFMERSTYSPLIYKVADNIISPLGMNTADNVVSVLAGRSRLCLHHGLFGLPEDFCGSVLSREWIESLFSVEFGLETDYTFFEKLCILSASDAMRQGGVDAAREDVVFVLSSTKGNVDCLAVDPMDERCYLASSAHRVARFLGNTNTPIVTSNACISGVCAQIAAVRQLLMGRYRTAVVIGCDVLSRFVISGFQSFKALSTTPCRPYDCDRTGLNLGEAVGTIILHADDEDCADKWCFRAGSIHNDANHISGPSRTGEGSYRVLTDILHRVPVQELACICTHGTATAYNDEMESIAIHRAHLDAVPVCGLKGYYGHTLGAAGVIETIISMASLEKGMIPATLGYRVQGTTYALNISDEAMATDRTGFIKILSGFGGSNAGIAYTKGGCR